MALTASQIVTLAVQAARCPGYVSQAGQLLNVILQELCQNYDFDVARTTYNFSLTQTSTTGPYPLPADFLRAKKDDFFYTLYGQPYFPVFYPQEEFDRFTVSPGLTDFPNAWTTDPSASPTNLYVWPPSSGGYQATLRYFRLMPDITTPETSSAVPWFPSTQYLRTRLAAELMQITDDERQVAFLANSEDILRRFLEMKDDPEGAVKRVTLDRRRFGVQQSALQQTKLLGW